MGGHNISEVIACPTDTVSWLLLHIVHEVLVVNNCHFLAALLHQFGSKISGFQVSNISKVLFPVEHTKYCTEVMTTFSIAGHVVMLSSSVKMSVQISVSVSLF